MKALYNDGSVAELPQDEVTHVIRHSAAHIMAQAIKRLYPEADFAYGPATDNGFYYDVDLPEGVKISEDDFPAIEAEMKKIVKENLKFSVYEKPRAEAIALMEERGEKYKVEHIGDLDDDARITFYQQGDYIDMCVGPHICYTKALKAFKLTGVSGAYWKDDKDNKMLTRINGVAFATKEELDEHMHMLEEAKKRDHRKIGREMDLFMMRDEALRLGLADAAYATIGEAVAAEHPDAALVCTAPLAHAAVIGELLDHDLPVFTELNLVSDGYRENMAKAAAKKLPLFLSSTMLYRRETQYIKQQVAEFGKPVHYIYHIGQYLPDWHPWENYKNFFVGNARTGGVREIFGIDLPWLLDAFGDVESVTVQKDTISDLGLPYPDCVTLLLRHKGGVQGVLAADVVSRKAVRSFECFGDGIHLFWEGNPKALYEFKDGDKRFVNTYASFEHDSRYSDNVVENAYVDELTNFFGVLKGDEQPKWSFEKDLKAIELMDRIEKA